MNLERVEKIAEAVLYEGYMLYPYRPSSVKNRQRWNFGVLCPQSYSEQEHGSEAWTMQTECLVKADPSTRLTVKVRFLQLVQRSVGKLRYPQQEPVESRQGEQFGEPEFDLVDRLEIEGHIFQPWQEAVEREVTSTNLDPALLSSCPPVEFVFPSGKNFESLRDSQGKVAGVIVRQWETLNGSVQFDAQPAREGVIRVTVKVHNVTPFRPAEPALREAALAFSLISAHTILGVDQGEFLSLLEPPAGLEDIASQCKNVGTWPVLVGDQAQGRAQTVLSSPIILYDYPQIAPESAGNLFDSTEIDEILSLRILTLTDEEKSEMRQSDDRSRQILERTESMPEEQFMKLHGALRGLAPLKEQAR